MANDAVGKPLVSVVIPVHNAGAYLRQCLDSVLGQTLGDLEVIAVDDASSDGSAELLETLSSRDQRLSVIHFQQNRGVSAARNAGLAAATGEFVAFVDADDYLDAQMYETLLTTARSLDCDVVSCGLELVDALGKALGTSPFPLPSDVRLEPAAIREHLHGAFKARMLWYPVRSLYSRKSLAEHGIRFDEKVRKGEDSLFNMQALHFANGVAAISATPYRYRQHSGSVTARPLASESENIENLATGALSFYTQHGYDDRARLDFYSQLLRSDLPTALVRLTAHPNAKSEIQALIQAAPVRDAFRVLPLREMQVPRRVLVLLALAKFQATSVLTALLRAYSRFRTQQG